MTAIDEVRTLLGESTFSGPAYSIAANDSLAIFKRKADITCSGDTDEDIINSALASKSVILLPGTYSILKGIFQTTAKTLFMGSGEATILQCQARPNSALSANASSGQAVVSVVSSTGFEAGMEVMLIADDYYGWYVISSISGNDITMTTNLAQAYTTANSAQLIMYGYPIVCVGADDCETSHFRVAGNRTNLVGGITNWRNGANDGSNTHLAINYVDGSFTIGAFANVDKVRAHHLRFDNTSEHAIGIYGQEVAVDRILVYRNFFSDIGDKAIIGRFTGAGTLGYVDLSYNEIDGTGKSAQTDLSGTPADNFSYGDGIQIHTTGARAARISHNKINDVARSGIWCMQSDASEVLSEITHNIVTNWGQKVFGSADEANADISGISSNRALVDISHNKLDSGFTDAAHRGAPRCYGVNLVPSVASGGGKIKSIVSDNIIKGCYGNTEAAISMVIKTANDVICHDNIADDGDVGLELTGTTRVDIHDNNFGDTDIQLLDSTHTDLKIHNNRAGNVEVNTSGTYAGIIEVYDNDLKRGLYGGVTFTPTTTDTLQSVIRWCNGHRAMFPRLPIADTEGVLANQAGTAGVQTITTGLGRPGGRNLSVTCTNNDTPSGDITLKGFNARGEYEVSTITISAGSTAYGDVAYLYLTEIGIPATIPVADTIDVGFSDKLGLTRRIGQTGSVSLHLVNGVSTAVSTSKEDITNHTYDCATIGKEFPLAAIADDGGAQTDETSEAASSATNDMQLIGATTGSNQPEQNDAYYFGYKERFNRVDITLSTQGVGTYTITWEYYDFDGTWQSLAGVSDGTTGFTATTGTKSVTFTEPASWALATVNSQGPYYLIRARVSSATGGNSLTTACLGEQAWIFAVESDIDLVYRSDRNNIRA